MSQFSPSYFLILLHANTVQQCYYIKNPNHEFKDLTKFHLKNKKIFHKHGKNKSSHRGCSKASGQQLY